MCFFSIEQFIHILSSILRKTTLNPHKYWLFSSEDCVIHPPTSSDIT